jgi:hypothetical protein
MPLQRAVSRDQAHTFDLALRKQHAVEGIVGGGLLEQVFDGVMMVHGKKYVSECGYHDRQVRERRSEAELSEPHFDRHFPKAGDTHKDIVGAHVQQKIYLGAKLLALLTRDWNDDVAVEQQFHFFGVFGLP